MEMKKFTPADKSVFLEMCRDFYSGGAASAPIPESRMEKTFDLIAAGTPYAFGYLFITGGSAAGYAIGFPFYSNEAGCFCLMLEEIYVKPGFRSQKLGSQYLATVADVLSADLGVPFEGLKLEICPSNERAHKLYTAMGFEALVYTNMVKKVQRADAEN